MQGPMQMPFGGMGGQWTKELGGTGGTKFCQMPNEVWQIKIKSGTVIDGIQLVGPNFQGGYHGGKGGKQFFWDTRSGVTKILIGYGHFHGVTVITGLCFCNGAGYWSPKFGKFYGSAEQIDFQQPRMISGIMGGAGKYLDRIAFFIK